MHYISEKVLKSLVRSTFWGMDVSRLTGGSGQALRPQEPSHQALKSCPNAQMHLKCVKWFNFYTLLGTTGGLEIIISFELVSGDETGAVVV